MTRKRGRKSADEIATANVVSFPQAERPKPPANLTPQQQRAWREIVEALPASWFPRETWPLLEQYVRHADQARRIAKLIEQARASEWSDGTYLKLLAAQRRETQALKSLASSLRLSQQARLRPETAARRREGPGAGDKRPWEG